MDKLLVKEFGVNYEGRKAYLYTLKNDNGVSVSVSDFGASLVSVCVPVKEERIDVVLGYEDASGYEQGDAAIGATVGRNANRIGGAQIQVAGVTYSLAKNDNDRNSLHSGPYVYQKRMWEVTENDDSHVTFRLDSPDNDQGFPGAVSLYVTYHLDEDNTLDIHYNGVPDADTIINMTNHSYFNLNGHDSGSALEHFVWVDADAFTPADAFSIPTGEIRPVDGTPMDFKAGKTLAAEIEADYEPLHQGNGYDHNWVLKNEGKFDKVAEVTGDKSGIRMEIWTDRPGMQIYTANFLDHEPGKGGAFYEKRSAVCFETQCFPDAIHHDNFPSPVCRKGEAYDTHTAYRFVIPSQE